jgi:hypothetical protein
MLNIAPLTLSDVGFMRSLTGENSFLPLQFPAMTRTLRPSFLYISLYFLPRLNIALILSQYAG